MKTIAVLLAATVLAATADVAPQCPPRIVGGDPTTMALGYVYCLGDPDPKIRDSVSFESLTTLLRSGKLPRETQTAARARP